MRLKEQRLWDRFRGRMPRHIRLERVENGIGTGMADVHCISKGLTTWVELKAVDGWPARESTPVLGEQDGLSIDQRNWHMDYQAHGGRSCVIVGVGLEVFMFNDIKVIDLLNKLNKRAFYDQARTVNWDAIILYLGKA